ncbi:MAG TPA: HD domain-containing protein [Candidatus Saccharimonadales bacterium]|nr:HD domain-containing protein [Candidatus Saccharimonadales bacterium]
MDQPDITRLLSFQSLLLQFQAIERVTHIPGSHRPENDTEHSYNLAMTAWFVSQYFPELDKDTVIRYALIHDLVEVHAGDTYVYADQAMLDSKHEREAAALAKLEAEWPDFPAMANTIKAYELRADAEAKFVYALDKIMPIMVIFLSEGYTWQQEGITPERLDQVKRHKVAVSPEIEPYYQALYQLLLANRHFFASSTSKQG